MGGAIADVRGVQDLDEMGKELWPEMLGGKEHLDLPADRGQTQSGGAKPR